MFWKKKNKAQVPAPLMEYEDQRAAFRYVFRCEARPLITFKGKPVKVFDISAGGLAFENRGFAQYDSDQIFLDLEIPNFSGDSRLSLQVRILNLTRNDICHCIFENCPVESYEVIHKYVLEMQKKDLHRG